jgi:uncharacterized protein (TIGR00251 family)
MLIKVYVTPNAKQSRVVKISDDYFEVWVDGRAVAGRANRRLLEILAEHFNIPKSKISIIRGTRSRDKTVQLILQPNTDPTSR